MQMQYNTILTHLEQKLSSNNPQEISILFFVQGLAILDKFLAAYLFH